jgi:DNA modification methylase
MSKLRSTTPGSPLRPFQIWHGDNLRVIPQRVPKGQAKLACIDPPYNIGQPYSDYVDRKTRREYLDFLCPRIARHVEYLHDHGSIWILINDANVSEVDVYCKGIGLFPRKKVTWYYTFGQNNSKNFTQSKATWLYYTKHRTKYTFNANDPAVRIPSARQTVYNDKRANGKGRLPDDVWVLRPQELPAAFHPFADCWYFSRVCGTFKAKVGASPNQIPVLMLDRIIRFCTDPDDLVVDGFGGSMSCGEAAVLAGRRFIGIDLAKGCVNAGYARLDKAIAEAETRNAANARQLELFDGGGDKPRRRKSA